MIVQDVERHGSLLESQGVLLLVCFGAGRKRLRWLLDVERYALVIAIVPPCRDGPPRKGRLALLLAAGRNNRSFVTNFEF